MNYLHACRVYHPARVSLFHYALNDFDFRTKARENDKLGSVPDPGASPRKYEASILEEKA